MCASVKKMWWSSLKCLVILAGASGLAPANAQDCQLSVNALPQVLYSGQSANVDVSAHFPSRPAPNGVYAFASSTFDVCATHPEWTFASAGTIMDNHVRDIYAGQGHWPQRGIFADPANPFRVWHGVLEPKSRAPALVEIQAVSTEFSVYPSRRSPSSAEREVGDGSDYVLVNPLTVGRWLAAPGAGTAIQVQDDVMIDGHIITGENYDSVAVGLFPTNVKTFHCPSDSDVNISGKITSITADISDSAPGGTWTGPILLDSSTTVGFDQPPSSFTAIVQVLGEARGRPLETVSLNFNSVPIENTSGGHVVGVNAAFCDGSVRVVRFDGFLGGVYVASGDLVGDANSDVPDLVVSALPQTIGFSVGSRTLDLTAANTYDGSTSAGAYGIWQDNYGITLCYDQPAVAIVRGSDGNPVAATLDRIEIQQITARPESQRALGRLSLGCHVFEADGVRQMRITPR